MEVLGFLGCRAVRFGALRQVNAARVCVRRYGQNVAASSAQASDSSSKSSSAAQISSSGPTALIERGPFASRLKTRGVVGFDGDDVFKFLQGLATNDVMQLSSETHESKLSTPTPNQPGVVQPPVYTGILNPQGRFMFDMFLYRPVQDSEKLDRSGSSPGSGRSVPLLVADVDAQSLEDLMSYFKRHVLRSKVSVENLSDDLAVWQRFGGALTDPSSPSNGSGNLGWAGGRDIAGSASAQGNGKGWRWFRDPRLDALGFRGVFPTNTTPPLVEADQEVDEQYYLLWRLEQGVPEGPAEISGGEAIPLEYNMAALNAISFEKGCYVGQELIARTHHRGVIRKRLMPLNFIQENGEEISEVVIHGAELLDTSGKKAGTVTTALGGRGFGVVRLEAAMKEEKLKVRDLEGVFVKVIRPKWWPTQWGQEV